MSLLPEVEFYGHLTSDEEDAWRRFGEAVFRPRRPMLDRAVAAAREVLREFTPRRASAADLADALSDPRAVAEAWEALCTRMDAEALASNPRRSFLPYVEFRQNLHASPTPDPHEDRPTTLSPSPLNVETIVALLAAGLREVERVEGLALEAARRMVPWGMPEPTSVAWTALSPMWPERNSFQTIFNWPMHAARRVVEVEFGRDRSAQLLGRARHIGAAVREAAPPPTGRFQARFVPRMRAVTQVSHYAPWWDAWRMLASRHQRIPAPSWGAPSAIYPAIRSGPLHATFASVPNALDPMLHVWGLGYALVDVRWDVVILGAIVDFKPVSATSMPALMEAQSRRYGDGFSRREAWPDQARRRLPEPQERRDNPRKRREADGPFERRGERLVGYKVMRYDPDARDAVSGADSRVRVPLRVGATHTMDRAGIFLGASRDYVMRHYATHDSNVLITYLFDPADVTRGSLTDREPEIAVRSAEVLDVELYDEDLAPLTTETRRLMARGGAS